MGYKIAGAVVAAALLLVPAAQGADIPANKIADIHKLIEVTKMSTLVRQMSATMIGQMVAAIKRSNPGIPEGAMGIIRKDLKDEVARRIDGPGGLLDRMVPIYAKHYSGQEVQGLVRFYQSPLGRKLVTNAPLVMRQAAAVGREWGREMAPALMERVRSDLRQAGYLKHNPGPGATPQ